MMLDLGYTKRVIHKKTGVSDRPILRLGRVHRPRFVGILTTYAESSNNWENIVTLTASVLPPDNIKTEFITI
ncbi:hypothetical protein ACFLXF_00385 [Chloroflexota bacterium]